jgi:hypothetical protein
VWAGETIARVGRSGRASTNHLHLEVRLADDPAVRWERTRAVNPVHFIRQRSPALACDTSWAGPYLDWADRTGLLMHRAVGDEALTRGSWHALLARATCHTLLELPRDGESLRGALIEQGILPERDQAPLAAAPSWREIARDLARAATLGIRLPPGPLPPVAHGDVCLVHFGRACPASHPRDLEHRDGSPTLGEALVLLADLAGPRAPLPEATIDRR